MNQDTHGANQGHTRQEEDPDESYPEPPSYEEATSHFNDNSSSVHLPLPNHTSSHAFNLNDEIQNSDDDVDVDEEDERAYNESTPLKSGEIPNRHTEETFIHPTAPRGINRAAFGGGRGRARGRGDSSWGRGGHRGGSFYQPMHLPHQNHQHHHQHHHHHPHHHPHQHHHQYQHQGLSQPPITPAALPESSETSSPMGSQRTSAPLVEEGATSGPGIYTPHSMSDTNGQFGPHFGHPDAAPHWFGHPHFRPPGDMFALPFQLPGAFGEFGPFPGPPPGGFAGGLPGVPTAFPAHPGAPLVSQPPPPHLHGTAATPSSMPGSTASVSNTPSVPLDEKKVMTDELQDETHTLGSSLPLQPPGASIPLTAPSAPPVPNSPVSVSEISQPQTTSTTTVPLPFSSIPESMDTHQHAIPSTTAFNVPPMTLLPTSLTGNSSIPQLINAQEVSMASFTRTIRGVETHDVLLEDPYQLYRFFVAHNDRPSMHVKITGSHIEKRTTEERNSDGTTRKVHQKVKVNDFKMDFDLTPYISPSGLITTLPDPQTGRKPTLRDVMEEHVEEENPFKELHMEKKVHWDYDSLTRAITHAIRSVHYRYTIEVSYPIFNNRVVVSSASPVANMMRSSWTKALCLVSVIGLAAYPLREMYKKVKDKNLQSEFKMTMTTEEFYMTNYWNIVDQVQYK